MAALARLSGSLSGGACCAVWQLNFNDQHPPGLGCKLGIGGVGCLVLLDDGDRRPTMSDTYVTLCGAF